MASSKRRPTRTAPRPASEAEGGEREVDGSDIFDAFEDGEEVRGEPKKRSRTPEASEPRKRTRDGKRSGAKRAGIEVSERAKDADDSATTRARRSASEERSRGRRRTAVPGVNPPWLAPTAVALLIIGLVYIVTYYLSNAQLPAPIGDANLLVGLGIMVAGGLLLMRWK